MFSAPKLTTYLQQLGQRFPIILVNHPVGGVQLLDVVVVALRERGRRPSAALVQMPVEG